ncbi:DJ-1/PfpI family protein [Enhydrobacter aerosaccus]|uniref:DJ-1/PfpI family protein n=1 Tax=Enhydrobacter aerosaccus TaxID=225324 RepID=A0A1T4MS76_9HYPH|nr:DJ-1/PfpI family protein [Enhydrobacter aerosaccus]SJZ69686.1 DJ-1/PfpI family protein [Enhydrobacter aerosaccus]
MMTRRVLTAAVLAAAAAGASAQATPAPARGKERIALLIYPGFTALDLFGPHNMLCGLMPEKIDLVAKTSDPVITDTGVTIVPSATFGDIAPGLDVLFVPGGTKGTLAALQDEATREFVARQGASARYVTSVCTGSLILGAAGLLRGYRATSHWVARDILSEFGAQPVDSRVVIDRNRVTGAGVSAGLDFGLTLVGLLRDAGYAQRVQLVAEYDPHPPFDAGTPAKAPADVTADMRTMFAPFAAEALKAARAYK